MTVVSHASRATRRAAKATSRPRTLRQHVASAMLSAVQCPFCGNAMRRGWMTTRGIALYPQFVAVNWLSDYEPREGSVVLAPRGFRRPRRGASCCPECEAMVVDPKVVDEER